MKNRLNIAGSPNGLRLLLTRTSKYVAAALFFIAAFVALRTLWANVNARTIQNSNHDQFWEIAEKTKLDRASVFELEAIAQRAIEATPPIIGLSENANQLLRSRLASCLTCENRTVLIELYKYNRLTDAAKAALSTSFSLSPYGDLDLMQWRLEVCNRYWLDLSDDQQKAALMQITAMAQQPDSRQWLMAFENPVRPVAERINRLR